MLNAQKAGYEAAIIYRNSPSSDIATMSGMFISVKKIVLKEISPEQISMTGEGIFIEKLLILYL